MTKNVHVKVIRPPSVKVRFTEELSIYCRMDTAYITTDQDCSIVWMDTAIAQHKKDVEYYKKRYENVMRGLCYWKSIALREPVKK